MNAMLHPRCIIPLVLCVLIALALVGAKSKKTDSAKDSDTDHAVTIKSGKFSPATITIQPGETVTWTNGDDRQHKIVADDKSFSSDDLNHGETFQHKFEKPGKYKYSCAYHPREKGTIEVAAADKK